MITSNTKTTHRCAVVLRGNPQPLSIRVAFLSKLEKKRTVVTSMCQMVRMAFNKISRRPWHLSTLSRFYVAIKQPIL